MFGRFAGFQEIFAWKLWCDNVSTLQLYHTRVHTYICKNKGETANRYANYANYPTRVILSILWYFVFLGFKRLLLTNLIWKYWVVLKPPRPPRPTTHDPLDHRLLRDLFFCTPKLPQFTTSANHTHNFVCWHRLPCLAHHNNTAYETRSMHEANFAWLAAEIGPVQLWCTNKKPRYFHV